VHGLAGVAHDLDGLLDLSPVVLVEGVEVVFDAADQLPQSRDFGVRRYRLGGAQSSSSVAALIRSRSRSSVSR
jgi:hypothetical protein